MDQSLRGNRLRTRAAQTNMIFIRLALPSGPAFTRLQQRYSTQTGELQAK
jgi:hypothetical protein